MKSEKSKKKRGNGENELRLKKQRQREKKKESFYVLGVNRKANQPRNERQKARTGGDCQLVVVVVVVRKVDEDN